MTIKETQAILDMIRTPPEVETSAGKRTNRRYGTNMKRGDFWGHKKKRVIKDLKELARNVKDD